MTQPREQNWKIIFWDAFNKYVGQGPEQKTMVQLSEETDIGLGTLKAYYGRTSAPSSYEYLSELINALGEPFANQIFNPLGLAVSEIENREAPAGPTLARELADKLAMLLRHFEDGFEDHREEIEAYHQMNELNTLISAYIQQRHPTAEMPKEQKDTVVPLKGKAS